MKINQNNIVEFIANIPPSVKSILIYGPDNGLVLERTNAIIAKVLNNNSNYNLAISEFSYEKLKDNLEHFFDALLSLSLTGEKRILKVYDVRAAMIAPIQDQLVKYSGKNMVIFSAGDLPPSSTVRKFFETNAGAAAIPCYHDEQKTIRNIIIQKFKSNGFSYDNEALAYLEINLAGDRKLILNEIEKLMLYKADDKYITTHDVINSTTNQQSTSLDELCHNVAGFNSEAAILIIQHLLAENIQFITIIRALSRYFIRLYEAKLEENKGVLPINAIKVLEPPVFFKNTYIFLHHLKNWTSTMLIDTITELSMIEISCKKTGTPVQLILNDFVLKKSYQNRGI